MKTVNKLSSLAFVCSLILAAPSGGAAHLEAGEASKVDMLIEEAMELGYSQGDIAGATRRLEEATSIDPANGQAQIRLARALLTIGAFEEGSSVAERALQLAPEKGGAYFAMVQALLLTGETMAARTLALETLVRDDIEFGRGDRGGLTLTLVSILMHNGEFQEAADLLVGDRPGLASLPEQELPRKVDEIGGGWHAVVAYAHILRELGEGGPADRLLARFGPLDEDYLRERDGAPPSAMDLWNLAATGAGRIPDDLALDYLERASAGGFVMGWRYNFEQHPTLWPLRHHPRFRALIDDLEEEMSRQRDEFSKTR